MEPRCKGDDKEKSDLEVFQKAAGRCETADEDLEKLPFELEE